MSVYVVAQLEVHDQTRFAKYLEGFHRVFTRHGGRLVAVSPEAEVVEGAWAMPRTVVMRFPTRKDARRWHADADYVEIARLRHSSARANIVLVDGVD